MINSSVGLHSKIGKKTQKEQFFHRKQKWQIVDITYVVK